MISYSTGVKGSQVSSVGVCSSSSSRDLEGDRSPSLAAIFVKKKNTKIHSFGNILFPPSPPAHVGYGIFLSVSHSHYLLLVDVPLIFPEAPLPLPPPAMVEGGIPSPGRP